MLKLCCFFATFFFLSCKSPSYFVVRHAEKETATMSSDVPLSAEGKQRAEALKEVLLHKNIQSIYSTNYIRTKTTAQPLAEAKSISIQIYDPADTSFVPRIKNSHKGNVLIVGHSNTVDDIVNRFMGAKIMAGDLPETQYGDLFVVKKKGNRYRFEKDHFGK